MHAPLSPAFRVEWREASSLTGIADEWRALAARTLEPNVFYDPAFMLAAAPAFGAGLHVALVRTAGGKLVGLFPSRIERPRGSLPAMLVGWTHPYAPLGTPLIDREDSAGIVAAWLDHLGRDRTVPRLLLMPLLTEGGAFTAALDSALAESGRDNAIFGRHRRALLDPGAEREGYIARALSAGKRKELRRQRRRLEDSAPITFTTAHSADSVAAALEDFRALEAAGWKGRAGTAIAANPAIRDIVCSAVVTLAAQGRARIDRMLLGDRAIAASITLASGDTAWCWKIAYDETVARASPGVQLMCNLTDDLLTQPGPARVDSCAVADHPMIDHLWRERLTLGDRLIALRPSAVPFALTCRMERMRRSAVAAMKAMRDRMRGPGGT
jgi:CelD/BcsL family acetyltransferase involved in cellulose biosynthesis